MVKNKPTDDRVTNLPTNMDTKVMKVIVTNNPMLDMVTRNLMVNTTVMNTNLTENRSKRSLKTWECAVSTNKNV